MGTWKCCTLPTIFGLVCFSPHITFHVITLRADLCPTHDSVFQSVRSHLYIVYTRRWDAQPYSFVLMLHLQAGWNILECQLKLKISFPWSAFSTCLWWGWGQHFLSTRTRSSNVIPPFLFTPAYEQTSLCKTQEKDVRIFWTSAQSSI